MTRARLDHALELIGPDEAARRALVVWLARHYDEAIARMEPPAVAAMLQSAGVRVMVEAGQVVRVTVG